jgi:hypothetical protein
LEIYREYCRRYEDRSLRAGSHGGKWTNQSCEKQFGAPNAEGDLSGNGAPRWKQRAFYDFVKDLSWQLIGVRVVRIAIWDKVEDKIGERTIEEVLAKPAPDSGMVLAALIFQRFPR